MFMSTAIRKVEITLHMEFHSVLRQCITAVSMLLKQEEPLDEAQSKLQVELGHLRSEACKLVRADADHIGLSKLMTAEQKKVWNDRSLDIRNMIDDYVGLFEFLSAASWH